MASSVSVCLLLDDSADRAVRGLWRRVEAAGVATLQTHTHGRHIPHLTLASLTGYRLDDLRQALAALPAAAPSVVRFDAVGMFPRSRTWLAAPATTELLARHQAVAAAVGATGAVLHRHYRPGAWLPHLTVAPRLRLEDVATLARHAFEVLPLTGVLERAALVETRTGDLHRLPHLI